MLEKKLQQQLKKANLSEDNLPQSKEQWQTFVTAINSTYISDKSARYSLKKSMDESSHEMIHLNKDLKEEVERRIDAVTESRVKSHLIENMSHEIRIPIHGVLGSLEIIKGSSNLDEKELKFINSALMSAENLLDIVNNLSDFSKINAGKLDLEEITFGVRELLADVNYIVGAMSEEKKLILTTVVSNDVPERIKGDPAKLRQIIMNLANNAIKFTHQGKITSQVQLVKQNEQETIIRFEITDTGIGISESKVDEIFSAFTQLDASTTKQFEGIGLGLTISKELVHLMGGSINLESIEGKGTHFWVDIPFKSVDINDVEEKSNASDLSSLKVLVVEKQGSTHSVLNHYFSMWGITYEFVDNCGEAIEKLYQGRDQLRGFNVVMVDYYMPGMESYELSELLNTHQDFQGISKVILSSYNLAEQEREIANIKMCLVKPIRETLLKDMLLECVMVNNHIGEDSENLDTSLSDDLFIDNTDILLAEDNPVNALLAMMMMEQIGLTVKHVKNGQQAVNEVQNNLYKLVLMDIHMPIMNGYKATQNIRQWEKDSKLDAIPIIALTANVLADDKEKCISAGMNDYLPKPIKQKVLQQIVAKWVEKEAVA